MTYNEARDEILAPFYQVWRPTAYPVFWADLIEKPRDIETPWTKVIIKHIDERQATLTDYSGVLRYRATGFVFVMLYYPMGQGSNDIYDMADRICNSYRQSKDNGILFKNIRSEERGVDGNYNQIDINAQFIYDKKISRR